MGQHTSSSPSADFVAVTPHDSNKLTGGRCRGLSVNVAGNVAIKNTAGTTVSITLVAGVVHPISTDQVLATDTTATGIVAYY